MVVCYLDIDRHKMEEEKLKLIYEMLHIIKKLHGDSVRIYERLSANGNIHFRIHIDDSFKTWKLEKQHCIALRYILFDDNARIQLDIKRLKTQQSNAYIDWVADIKNGKKAEEWREFL